MKRRQSMMSLPSDVLSSSLSTTGKLSPSASASTTKHSKLSSSTPAAAAAAPRPLPLEFEPTPYSVIIGRGKSFNDAVGNQRLRTIATSFLPKYTKATTKNDKTLIVSNIVDMVQVACPKGASFIKLVNGRWWQVDTLTAREKVGYVMRDLLSDKYKSSSKAKVAKRRIQREGKGKATPPSTTETSSASASSLSGKGRRGGRGSATGQHHHQEQESLASLSASAGYAAAKTAAAAQHLILQDTTTATSAGISRTTRTAADSFKVHTPNMVKAMTTANELYLKKATPMLPPLQQPHAIHSMMGRGSSCGRVEQQEGSSSALSTEMEAEMQMQMMATMRNRSNMLLSLLPAHLHDPIYLTLPDGIGQQQQDRTNASNTTTQPLEYRHLNQGAVTTNEPPRRNNDRLFSSSLSSSTNQYAGGEDYYYDHNPDPHMKLHPREGRSSPSSSGIHPDPRNIMKQHHSSSSMMSSCSSSKDDNCSSTSSTSTSSSYRNHLSAIWHDSSSWAPLFSHPNGSNQQETTKEQQVHHHHHQLSSLNMNNSNSSTMMGGREEEEEDFPDDLHSIFET